MKSKINSKTKADRVVRFFGASDCHSCMAQEQVLRKLNIPFDYIDALADDTQEFCDGYNVDELPHLQILDGGRIIKEFIGFTDPKAIIKEMEDCDKT